MLQLGDLNGAWRAFDDALGLQPNNLEALFNKYILFLLLCVQIKGLLYLSILYN